MGWTGIFDVDKRDIHNEVENIFVRDKISGTSDNRFDILLHSTYGSTHYLAVRDNTDGIVRAFIILTHYDSKDKYFMYKDLCEDMGCQSRGAPLKILSLLSDTNNELALQWREEVRNWNARQSWLKKRLVHGAVIEFNSPVHYSGALPSDTFTLCKKHNKRGFSLVIPSGGLGRTYHGWKEDIIAVDGDKVPTV